MEEKHKVSRVKILNAAKIGFIAAIGFILVFLGVLPSQAMAASLIFSPSSGSYHQNENFTVSVLLNTDKSANAVRGVVLYSTKYVGVISVNYTNSVIDLWVRKPSFSNFGDSGNVTFEGIILNPGFTGSGGRIANIVFRVKEQGSAGVEMTDFAILANDGLATNIASAGGKANFVFTSPLPPGQTKSTTDDKTIAIIDEKVTAIKEKIKTIEEQIKFIPFAQEVNFYQRIGNLWEILPIYIKFITVTIIGALAIFLLIILGLVIVVIIWVGNHARYASRKLLTFIGIIKKELESDIVYGSNQFKENYQEATQQIPIRIMIRDYFSRIRGAIKRFFEINNRKEEKIFKIQKNDDEDKDNRLN